MLGELSRTGSIGGGNGQMMFLQTDLDSLLQACVLPQHLTAPPSCPTWLLPGLPFWAHQLSKLSTLHLPLLAQVLTPCKNTED